MLVVVVPRGNQRSLSFVSHHGQQNRRCKDTPKPDQEPGERATALVFFLSSESSQVFRVNADTNRSHPSRLRVK